MSVVNRLQSPDQPIFETLVQLFESYLGFYGRSHTTEAVHRYLRDRIVLQESVVFVATVGGNAVGFAQLYPTFSSLSLLPHWYLSDLFVAAEARGCGVGSALLRSATDHAAATGSNGLSLETGRDNVEAQRLYEGAGWLRDDQFIRYGFPLPAK